MNIAFATTQSPTQSTVVGRILPLASRLIQKHGHTVHILGHHGNQDEIPSKATFHSVGKNPFKVLKGQKTRHSGITLLIRLLRNTIATCRALDQLRPSVIVIVKSLPQNVAGVSLYLRWLSLLAKKKPRVILDVDDYELTANQLSSLPQRAAVHWSQQHAHFLADHIIAATPFLQEYSRQLAPHQKPRLIPTTATVPDQLTSNQERHQTDKHSPTERSPVVLYIGSLSISSGHRLDLLPDIWQEVVEQIPAARLRIAGDGHDADQIRKQFTDKNLDNSVTFTGRFDPPDLANILKDVTVIIDPIDATITNRAKSSYRASLAAHLGIAYLSSNIGIRPLWFPQSLHSQFFAQPADVADYARVLVNQFNNPLTADQQQAMRQHATRYTWDNLTPLYHKALAS